MALLAFMCLGVAVKGFSQFDISKTTLKVDWQMNAPFSTDFADKLSGWGMNYELGYQFTPRWEAGVFASFHTNHKYVGRQTLSLSPTESLTTDQQRSAFQVPFGVMGAYNLSTNRYIKPYIGVNERLLDTSDMRMGVAVNRRAEEMMIVLTVCLRALLI